MTPANAFVDTPYTPLFQKYDPCPPGYEEHWYAQYVEIPVTASQIISKLPLKIDTDVDFRWRSQMGSLNYQFQIRLYDPWGNPLSNSLLMAELVLSKASPPVQWPEILCPAGSTPLIDITEYTGNPGTLKLALLGVKRYMTNA